jgi:hypothetical protein
MTNNSKSPIKLSLSGTIDRLENNKAIIKTEDGQLLNWPINILPGDTTEGEAVELCLCSDKAETFNKESIAKAVLNEIFKTDD